MGARIGHQRTNAPSLAVPLTVPSPLAPLYAYFPLVTYSSPNDVGTTPAPPLPTLWALGPPPPGHKESLDPLCRQAQAWTRFSGIQAEPRWLQHGAGAPGNSLPALHLPEGDLLGADEVVGWIAAAQAGKGKQRSSSGAGAAQDESSPAADPTVQAYSSLVETTLLPAVMAALYLSPSSPPRVVPDRSLPILSAVAAKFLGVAEKRDHIAQVKKMRGGKVGSRVVLDLEEVEREAVEALEALEVKMKATEGRGEWFHGSSSPSQLDAMLYSLLSIISVLPASGDGGALRSAFDSRCPALVGWVKRHDP
ncbi:hypothetical protein JCM1841_005783 [Sporobolomyces salmonicolor]